jgi:hypothetical protein
MSQEIGFSVSSDMLDESRRDEESPDSISKSKDVINSLEYIASSGYSIEYLSSGGEVTEDILDDVTYAQSIGLEPRSIHLSVINDLDSYPQGCYELNTSTMNSQVAPRGEERDVFWTPQNIILHPPKVDDSQKKEGVARSMLENIRSVYEFHEEDEVVTNLLVENMPPIGGYLIQEPKDVEMIESIGDELDMLDKVQYVVDIGHTKDWEKMLEAYPEDRVQEFHLHNKRQRKDGGWENHIPPQEGFYDFDQILSKINSNFGHSDLVVELKPEHFNEDTIRETTEFLEEKT